MSSRRAGGVSWRCCRGWLGPRVPSSAPRGAPGGNWTPTPSAKGGGRHHLRCSALVGPQRKSIFRAAPDILGGGVCSNSPCCCCCLVAQSCPTLWDPMDCSPPGSSVHGISQARTLERVGISFSSRPPTHKHTHLGGRGELLVSLPAHHGNGPEVNFEKTKMPSVREGPAVPHFLKPQMPEEGAPPLFRKEMPFSEPFGDGQILR